MRNLADKTALVTCASHRTGTASVLALAEQGARILAHYNREEEEVRALVAQVAANGGRAHALAADLLAADGPEHLAREVRGAVGEGLDILIVNTNIHDPVGNASARVSDFEYRLNTNIRVPFAILQQLLPTFCDGGSIVFLSALTASTAGCADSAFSASKGMLETLVRHAAATLRFRGIRVNALTSGIAEAGGVDIGGILALLTSEQGRQITGNTIRIDGGVDL